MFRAVLTLNGIDFAIERKRYESDIKLLVTGDAEGISLSPQNAALLAHAILAAIEDHD